LTVAAFDFSTAEEGIDKTPAMIELWISIVGTVGSVNICERIMGPAFVM